MEMISRNGWGKSGNGTFVGEVDVFRDSLFPFRNPKGEIDG